MQKMRLADLFGDLVIYRRLELADSPLGGLSALYAELGWPVGYIPRKIDADYATVVRRLLDQAQTARGVRAPLERLIYIGDTRGSDGAAAQNLGRHWPIQVFIGEDKLADPFKIETQDNVTFANRWAALKIFLMGIQQNGSRADERTGVLIDIDKTILGARGRNDKPIDQTRVDAACDMARETLGSSFPMDRFRPVYDKLHQSAYHFFTKDNQDYLVYVSLMASAGVYPFETLLTDLHSGQLKTFDEFTLFCDTRLDRVGFEALRPIHNEVMGNLRQGDPTPFKSFRYREYECTVARMDALPDDTPHEKLWAEEITITREVLQAALELKDCGALLMGLSDKPDEASVPRPELALKGYRPLHRVVMKVTG